MYDILMNECQNKQRTIISLSLMTSTFILSGKKLIYVSRGLLILYLMLSHMLILTPCHIAGR